MAIRRSARGGLARDTPNVGLRLHAPRRGDPRARACRAAAVRQPLSLIIYSISLHVDFGVGFGLALHMRETALGAASSYSRDDPGGHPRGGVASGQTSTLDASWMTLAAIQ